MDDWGQIEGDKGEVTVCLPDASIVSVKATAVVYRRAFNRPTGLAVGDSVSLQCEFLPIAASICFNGSQVDVPSDSYIEIGDRLLAHNELVVRIGANHFQAASLATASLRIVHAT